MAKKETTKKATTKKKTTKKKVEAEPKVNVEDFEVAASVDTEVEVTEAEVEVMNGDPSVVTPVEEAEPVKEEETPREDSNVEVIEIKSETIEESVVEEIKPKNIFKRMFGYIWNGQEMDY